MDFSQALLLLKSGKSVTRKGWNGKGMYLGAQFPDENSANTRPYIFIICPPGSSNQFGTDDGTKVQRVPWLASQTDLFSEDWEEVRLNPAG